MRDIWEVNERQRRTPYTNVYVIIEIKRGWIIIVASDDDVTAASVVDAFVVVVVVAVAALWCVLYLCSEN